LLASVTTDPARLRYEVGDSGATELMLRRQYSLGISLQWTSLWISRVHLNNAHGAPQIGFPALIGWKFSAVADMGAPTG